MAGEADAERLVVLLEARIRDFEKNMAKASGTAERNYGRMRRDSRSATRQMEQDMLRSTSRINQALAASSAKIGAYGKAAIGGFLGGIAAGGVAGIISQIGQVANSIAQIGDEAKRAGVSAEAFQEWRFVAEQNRIGIDTMVDGLKELNLRADEFVQTGKGSAAEAFMRLGYGAEELQRKLKNPSALLLEIIDRLGKFDEAARIRISDELFGGSAGERFVELIDQGADGIRKTIDEAQELGIVLETDVVERAAELDRKFNAITATVSTGLKTAIVEAATELQAFINAFNTMWQRYEERRNAVEVGALAGSLAGQTLAPAGPETRTTPKTGRLPKAEWVPPVPPPGGFGGGRGGKGGAARDTAAEQAEREAQAVRKLIDELEEELRLVGATNAEKEVATTLRRAGVDAASKEGQAIADLVRQIDAETEAHERAQQAIEARAQAFENAFGMAADGLLSVVEGSVKAEDAVKKLAVQLALAAAQAALLGTGPLSGLFGRSLGGLFGGGGGSAFTAFEHAFTGLPGLWAKGGAFDRGNVMPFARGGAFTNSIVNRPTLFPMADGAGLMGESGPEAIMPLRRGPDGRLGVSAANQNGGSISAPITISIDATGADAAGMARVERQLADLKKSLPQTVIATIQQGKKRGAI